MTCFVYDYADATDIGRELLGGKGAGLAEMTSLGISVPAGFTVTTQACVEYMRTDGVLPRGLQGQIDGALAQVERATGLRFGDTTNPLLVSVRSGAAVSMPGMMDTILNLGLSDAAVKGLARATANERFAHDAYRRLLQMYGEVVEGINGHLFEDELSRLKAENGVQQDVELTTDHLAELTRRFKAIYHNRVGTEFPQDPSEQLAQAVRAVFDSWNTPRARAYRRANAIPDDLGTAANVVQMVFGNKGSTSGTGVCFTRDPSTGERGIWGEFLVNAQGEDVVAGARIPEPIDRMSAALPAAHRQLVETIELLEAHYRDMQDIEFTVEEGTLYLLQTRTGERSAQAALRVAVEMVSEGPLSKQEALARIDPAQLDQLLHPTIDPAADYEITCRGLNASPGAATGALILDADTAETRGRAGEDVILVRWETTPDDFHGMLPAKGILTARGGLTSHAAVVARGMGTPCVVGCEAIAIDMQARTVRLGQTTLTEGQVVTIDGTTGDVILGEVALVSPEIGAHFQTLLEWADEVRRLGVRANADTPEEAAKAREFGARGIGLCRTEHMFRDDDRLPIVREMIMATSEDDRRRLLEELLPIQQSDFEGIFEAMVGMPVTIRLLDWPLHEFLPRLEEAETPEVAARVRALREENPMLGWRGCRLGLLRPEIYEMQVRAISRAALATLERTGEQPQVEIMHPLVGFGNELGELRRLTLDTAAAELEQNELGLEFAIGTMVELPRACIRADEIAEHADFLSFGTNDLTQTTLGFSRDDAGKFLPAYLDDRVLQDDPFETIDQAGVGDLMAIGVERARATRSEIKLGICGEHGGDPRSVIFCHKLGLDYVSCSPFRVPLARLAAAQAALGELSPREIEVGG
ncbi:MAG: pyruvate, phosphate dikinase [Actinomycetia bacterium]|nr:pyruvate, phosphate dikinase [Actinomycetes bacterium]